MFLFVSYIRTWGRIRQAKASDIFPLKAHELVVRLRAAAVATAHDALVEAGM